MLKTILITFILFFQGILNQTITQEIWPTKEWTRSTPSKQQLNQDVLNELITLIDVGKDFATEQLPDVAKQMIDLAIFEAWFYPVLFGSIAVFALFLMLFFIYLDDKTKTDIEGFFAVFGVIFVINVIITIGSIFICIPDGIKAYKAPKVYIIQEIKELAK